MSDKASSTSSTGSASSKAASKAEAMPEGNPAFRMMGLPQIRRRLPSRNWLIFLSLVGSLAGAVYYDKYQTRRVREKYCKLVAPVAEEFLSAHTLPRRVTVYLAAPPGDGLRTAREHFHAYIKPVLVAGAMDWDVVEGRKEGDVRYKTAERIRRKRKRAGEGMPLTEEEQDVAWAVQEIREKVGTRVYDGVTGDLVVGRHTWKEYVRGLHEGWLGPVDAPKAPEPPPGLEGIVPGSSPGLSSLGDAAVDVAANLSTSTTSNPTLVADDVAPKDDASPTSPLDATRPDAEEKKPEEPKKPRNPPPYLLPADWAGAQPSRHTPEILGPSTAICYPHILGFLNTPKRIYRFLTRRQLAEEIMSQVAASVLAHNRAYGVVTEPEGMHDVGGSGPREVAEQDALLVVEERDWIKALYDPKKERAETVWTEDVLVDERLAARMRAFELSAEAEERAKRLGEEGELFEGA